MEREQGSQTTGGVGVSFRQADAERESLPNGLQRVTVHAIEHTWRGKLEMPGLEFVRLLNRLRQLGGRRRLCRGRTRKISDWVWGQIRKQV